MEPTILTVPTLQQRLDATAATYNQLGEQLAKIDQQITGLQQQRTQQLETRLLLEGQLILLTELVKAEQAVTVPPSE